MGKRDGLYSPKKCLSSVTRKEALRLATRDSSHQTMEEVVSWGISNFFVAEQLASMSAALDELDITEHLFRLLPEWPRPVPHVDTTICLTIPSWFKQAAHCYRISVTPPGSIPSLHQPTYPLRLYHSQARFCLVHTSALFRASASVSGWVACPLNASGWL